MATFGDIDPTSQSSTALHVTDAATIATLGTSGFWWYLVDQWGHMVLLFLGIAVAAVRLYMMIKQLRRKDYR